MYNEENFIDVQSYETYNSKDDFVIENGILCRCYAKSTVVTIEDGVTTIKKDAFKYLENKKRRERGWKCFCIGTEEENPTPLRKIVLPNSVTEIEEGAFANLEYLEEINLPNGITEIPNALFCNCHNLKEINIPDTVKKIGDNAFACCDELKKINIPDSIEEIGEGAFWLCIGVSEKNFNFSRSLKKIGKEAFWWTGARIAIFADCECGKDAFLACDDLMRKEI
ncbi:MAG: leucine-rich repeat domain-containing protein [Ruminococcus sp.]|nr:leucine-rich repeat domain-containing protein [Ruminococcus sp.]